MSKKIVITGGCGFIGATLIEHLLKNTDWEIVSIDRLDTSGNPNRLSDMECWEKEKHRVKVVYWDLKSEINVAVADMIGDFDYFAHLAAGSHVDRSIIDPMSFVMDNVVGTGNVLEFIRKLHPQARVIYFSTDEVFGSAPEGVAFKEFDRFNAGNPYSATKGGAELLCEAYANTYGLDIMVSHCMNVFGERQSPEKFVPLVIKKVLNGETVTIHSNADKTKSGTRFYLHTRNISAAVLFILEHGKRLNGKATEGKYNIVGDVEVSNLEMAQLIAEVIGKELKYEMVDFHSSRPGHDLRYALDGSLLKTMGFEYPVSFKDSLAKSINWTLQHQEWL